jgi:hypothetical protein
MACGSSRELEYQVKPCLELGFPGEAAVAELPQSSLHTCKLLNGLIRALSARTTSEQESPSSALFFFLSLLFPQPLAPGLPPATLVEVVPAKLVVEVLYFSPK